MITYILIVQSAIVIVLSPGLIKMIKDNKKEELGFIKFYLILLVAIIISIIFTCQLY